MDDTVSGSLEALNSLQLSSDLEGMDAVSKDILKNKEVLAVLLKGVVKEYQEYSTTEIMEFIETDSIVSDADVSTGRTNTRIQGENIEFVQLNEKTSNFDIRFLSKNPVLSSEVQVNLHIDVEPQKDYRPGYPIEKRGLYYLSRSLCSQLSVRTQKTDYNALEKCYSIWICRDNIPVEEQYSISYYEMENSKTIGKSLTQKEAYDLLSLVVIRLGKPECMSKEGILEFLSAIFYPHKKDFLDTVQKYIDFSQNEELWKEVTDMSGLGMSILQEGLEKGLEKGIQKGLEKGIQEGLEKGLEKGIQEGLEKGRANQLTLSVSNLMKSMNLSLEEACKVLGIEPSEYERARELVKQKD